MDTEVGGVSRGDDRAVRSCPIPEACWVPAALLVGVVAGLVLPAQDSNEGEPVTSQRISAVMGWTYFCAWTASFYPQLVQNWIRRSVVGLSLDYQLLNLVGFSLYFIFNALLYWNPHIQEEYRKEHDGNNSAVRLNDVLFAGHAAFITLVTLIQIAIYYDYPPLDKSDRFLRYLVVGGLLAVLLASAVLASMISASESHITWLSYIGALAEVKVVISFFKYCPQVWLNYRRKSTDGWNIYNVLLDFTGGSLSVAQLLLDAGATNDWSKVSGDPVKLLLGNLSMFFDIIFMLQHYCFYREARGASREAGALLPGDDCRRRSTASGAAA